MNPTLNYTVQIITEPEQLTEALSLRYKTYSKVYPKVTQKSARPFESDAFDSRSIHMGLYCERNGKKELAGYCRLIIPEYFKDSYAEYFIQHHDFYPTENLSIIAARLGFFKYAPESYTQVINSFCQELEGKEQFYAETSRLIIDEEHRSLSLSAFFTQSMFAIAASLKMKFNFFSADKHHAAFYQKNGLTPFQGLEPYSNTLFERDDVIFGTDLNFGNLMQASIRTLKVQLEEENQITFSRAA